MRIVEVKIKIKASSEYIDSEGNPEGNADGRDTDTTGFLHYMDDSILLTYSENFEGLIIYTDITYFNSDGVVTVKRSGDLNSEFRFKVGEVHKSLYRADPYSFNAEVKAHKVLASFDEAGGTIDLNYDLKLGGAHMLADMKIWISAISNQA